MLMAAFVIVVIFWSIKGLIWVISESKGAFEQAGSNETSREILKERELRAREYICDNPSELVMSTEFREERLKEYPSLVHVEDKLLRCKCLEEKYDIQKSDLDVFSYLAHKDDSDIRRYEESRVRHLVYQYINSIGNDDFYDAFAELLIGDKDLLLAFVQECHVAESWRKECNRLYDPENYMKDFMVENDIEKRIHRTNEHIKIPTDFRHRHPVTPSDPIKAYISTQKRMAENEIKISELAKSGTPKLRGTGFLGIIAVIMTVAWFFVNRIGPEASGIFFWITIITWFVFIFGGAFLNNDSDRAAAYQNENIKLAGQKDCLDMLSIWAQDYEKARCVKIKHKCDAEVWKKMAMLSERRREGTERFKTNAGGDRNDRG